MPANLEVAFLPSMLNPESLAERVVVVVDVLRATTTIINAIHNGADHVIPSPSIEGARELQLKLGNGSVMGGERGGKKVDGFQCGNSPPEYTREMIAGKSLILATTNGTVAMEQCRKSKAILIGAFVNLGAVAHRVADEAQVTILCSGTDGFVTSEDVLFAGALTEIMTTQRPGLEIKDEAKVAHGHWQSTQLQMRQNNKSLADFMRTARGGKNLVRIGHDADIVFSSQIDTIPIVPVLDVDQWKIRCG